MPDVVGEFFRVHPCESVSARVYARYQRWRRRERGRWKGLFRGGICSAIAGSEPAAEMSLERLGDGRAHVFIDGRLLIVCDGCGSLVQLDGSIGSSGSTLPPNPSHTHQSLSDRWVRCTLCQFATSLGGLRAILGMSGTAGAPFDYNAALALLVEAKGPQSVVEMDMSGVEDWCKSEPRRMLGLQFLLKMIGVCEEDLIHPKFSVSHNGQHLFDNEDDLAAREEAEAFICALPCAERLVLPFAVRSLSSVGTGNSPSLRNMRKEALDAAEISAKIVTEAAGIWDTILQAEEQTTEATQDVLQKLWHLGNDLREQQTRARMFNHASCQPQTSSRASQQ